MKKIKYTKIKNILSVPINLYYLQCSDPDKLYRMCLYKLPELSPVRVVPVTPAILTTLWQSARVK